MVVSSFSYEWLVAFVATNGRVVGLQRLGKSMRGVAAEGARTGRGGEGVSYSTLMAEVS